MKLIIAEMQNDECDALAALMVASIERLAAADYSAAQIEAWARLDKAAWPGRLQRQRVWVAYQEDQAVGFISLAAGGYIDLLYVSPDWARRGVATRLLATLEQIARQEQILRLITEASLTARPFFESQGFMIETRQRVDVRGKEFVNFLMEKALAA